MKLVIIDYGAGNTKSVQFALERIGVNSKVSKDRKEISDADGVIFPGVGHAMTAMTALKESKLDKLIPTLKQPFLGICLGMQLMCKCSEEGGVEGLGIFDTDVKRFEATLNVPHMGWNSITERENGRCLNSERVNFLYFVHSYYVPVTEETTAIATYGIDFSASLEKDNFLGYQFHPEKSGKVGEEMLKKFIKRCELFQQ